jgi:hydrogenase maturation protease
MVAPILIFAIGNESRGDDALAPILLRRLGRWVESQPWREDVELIEDFQLQVEHAMDMVGRKQVIFVDAGQNTPAPFSFHPLSVNHVATPFSHALAPEAVLATYVQIYGGSPPPSYVLCLRGEQFELGEPLSIESAERLDAAHQFLQSHLQSLRNTSGTTRIINHTLV